MLVMEIKQNKVNFDQYQGIIKLKDYYNLNWVYFNINQSNSDYGCF